MIRYIPKFILQNYEKNVLEGNIIGYVLLFDIADFTKIGTALQKEEKRGAEALGRFLDVVFAEPIRIVERYGGFISIFAGDAFCAIFPDGKGESIISVVNLITALFQKRNVYQTPFGKFVLKIRQTVCYGDINWQIFENRIQNEYVFYGETIQEVAELSKLKENTIFSVAAANKIGELYFEVLDKGYRLISEKIIDKDTPIKYDFNDKIKESFINHTLRDQAPYNEIRSAAYCFANLELIDFSDRPEAISLIEKEAEKYEGYVNKLDATDKGLTAIILFGMPHSKERTLERICSFSLDLVNTIPKIAIGISCGSVFAGYCGSGHNKEYTAIGSPMNLSARLMSKARVGEILTDFSLWQELHSKYSFYYMGMLSLKGLGLPTRYYRLVKRIVEEKGHQGHRFVGRDEELNTIKDYLNESISDNKNSVIYVSGDAGIGKTRLINETVLLYSKEKCHHLNINCDAITQTSLHSVKQIVKNYFYYNPLLPRDAAIQIFRGMWIAISHGDDEMLRIESIIASLLGYEWEGSVWSVLSGDEKPSQLQKAFIRFINQLAGSKPVIINIDNCQWIDKESKMLFQMLSEQDIKPVIIIAACRYLEDGEKVDLELPKHQRFDLELSFLSDTGCNSLIKTILRLSNVPPQTLNLIKESSMGNPLFIEQFTAYLMENGNIDEKGIIQGEIGYLSSFSISDIISSRIDRLTDNVKECLSNASVLGREFNTLVLSKMLNTNPHEELRSGTKNRIWKDLDGIRYIFTHIFIKDIVYGRMLTEKLQKLHLAAAKAMEHVYNDKLEENSEEIAIHFEKGNTAVEAAHYYNKAGCFYRDKYDFYKSERNFRKCLEIRETSLGIEHPDTVISITNLANLYLFQGKLDQAEPLYIRALGIRERVIGSEHPDTASSLHCLATLYRRQRRYYEAESFYKKAIEIREKVLGKEHPDTASSIHSLATLYRRQRRNYEAEPLYTKALEIREKALGKNHPAVGETLRNIAAIYRDLGRYDVAESFYKQAYEIFDKVFGKDHPDASPNSLAIMYLDQARYEEAEPLFRRSLEINEKYLGKEHPETATSLHNLAELNRSQRKYDAAEPLYKRSLQIYERVLGSGHPHVATSLICLASLYQDQSRYDEAEPLYKRSLQIDERVLGSSHPDVAITMGSLGYIYVLEGRYTEAEPYLLNASQILLNKIGDKHQITIRTLKTIVDMYEKTGENEKAKKFRKMLEESK